MLPQQMQRLRVLSLDTVEMVGDAGTLRRYPKLEVLKILPCSGFSTRRGMFENVYQITQLVDLDITCGVIDLQSVCTLSTLQRLRLDDCYIKDIDGSLNEVKHLKTLQLLRCYAEQNSLLHRTIAMLLQQALPELRQLCLHSIEFDMHVSRCIYSTGV